MTELEPNRPVFFDPDQRRWKRWRLWLGAFFALMLLIFVGWGVGLLTQARLPALALSQNHRLLGQHTQPARQAVPPSILAAQLPDTNSNNTKLSTTPVSTSSVIGFYVNWDDNSFVSLKQNYQHLDILMPEWLHLGVGGRLVLDNLQKQEKARAFVRDHKPSLQIQALVNNYNGEKQGWDDAVLTQALKTVASRQHLVQGLLEYVQRYHLDGINIDFENLSAANQPRLLALMQQLHAVFAPLGLSLTQDVPLDDPSFDYRALAAASDHLILMGYDEHEDSSEAGAVASQPWLLENLQERIAEVGAGKIILALGSYGYDWSAKGSANEVTFQDAQTLAKDAQATVSFERPALNPHFSYDDENGIAHTVWYLDAVSAFDQALAANHLGISSLALWRIGEEDPSIWQVLNHASLNADVAQRLSQLHYGYDLDYEGQGELLKVSALPHAGSRQLGLDKNGLIDHETVKTYATPYQITRWGGNNPKKLVLTFDDGPDPVYTPQILDILEREHVPATFFVIGANADAHPDLVRRMLRGGFELGNHTYTHPNLSLVGATQFDLELNSTQRLLESEFGVSTVLFRPPYAEDVEPETPDQAGALVRAGELGYYTVGMQIDPLDWHSHNPKQIVADVLHAAQAHDGNVILLHDAGGDRSATVAALPSLIHALRAKGFDLVSTANLLGVKPNQINPNVTSSRSLNDVSGLGFSALNWLGLGLTWLFLGGIALSVGRLILIGVLALLEARKTRQLESRNVPTMSVIVPAYNEEKVVCKTIQSLLGSSAIQEILVIDDGSKDNTFDVVQAAFLGEPRVRLFRLPNGGKSRALNFGLSQANGEIVLLLDADTILRPDAPAKLLRHFAQADIAAVAGNAKVGNRVNVLTRWQALEYITAQNLERRALAFLGCITVVPGAIGAWRRDLLLERGGFQTDTLAEDADLTMRLLRDGYRIGYEPEAVALTEAPDTVQAFLKQRFRWMFGTLQAAYKQRDALLRPEHKGLGLFALPNVLVFQIFFPFISSLMDVAMLVQVVWVLVQNQFHPGSNPFASLSQGFWFYLLFNAVDALAASLAFALEPNEDWWLLLWLFPQRFLYRQLMYFVAIKAALAALQGQRVGWGKLERKANVVG